MIFSTNFFQLKNLSLIKSLRYGIINEKNNEETMSISLLEGSLQLDVFFDKGDQEFEDNICLCFKEDCPEEEKILYAGETNIYITPEQARELAAQLLDAAEKSSHSSR